MIIAIDEPSGAGDRRVVRNNQKPGESSTIRPALNRWYLLTVYCFSNCHLTFDLFINNVVNQ